MRESIYEDKCDIQPGLLNYVPITLVCCQIDVFFIFMHKSIFFTEDHLKNKTPVLLFGEGVILHIEDSRSDMI